MLWAFSVLWKNNASQNGTYEMTASLTRTISPDESEVRIIFSGRIDFHLHAEFCEAYRCATGPEGTSIIDLTHVESVDSSALGMFFKLRDDAGGERARIHFTGANPQVNQALKLANLHQVFVVREAKGRS